MIGGHKKIQDQMFNTAKQRRSANFENQLCTKSYRQSDRILDISKGKYQKMENIQRTSETEKSACPE